MAIDKIGFARRERNRPMHCDVQPTSPLKRKTYCRRLGLQTRSGSRDRSDPDVGIKAYKLELL